MKTVEWAHDKIRLIDQTRLPLEEVFVEYDDYRDVALAIKTMKVRGAPAIGVTAAFGIALAAQSAPDEPDQFVRVVNEACDVLVSTRPTAVNLFWAIDRMRRCLSDIDEDDIIAAKERLRQEAQMISDEDEAMCRSMGLHGSPLIESGETVLTH